MNPISVQQIVNSGWQPALDGENYFTKKGYELSTTGTSMVIIHPTMDIIYKGNIPTYLAFLELMNLLNIPL